MRNPRFGQKRERLAWLLQKIRDARQGYYEPELIDEYLAKFDVGSTTQWHDWRRLEANGVVRKKRETTIGVEVWLYVREAT